jgi:hypothetical protein
VTLSAVALGASAGCRGYDLCDTPSGSCGPRDTAGSSASDARGDEAEGGAAGAAAGHASTDGGVFSGRGGSFGGGGRGGLGGEKAGGEGPAGEGTTAGTRSGGTGGEGAGAGDGAVVGAGGAAGENGGGGGGGGGLVCSASSSNCDGSTLNGCETNVLENVRHCGECGRECAGLCTRGECLKFDVMIPGRYTPNAIALAPDFAYLAAHDSSHLLRLVRVSRWTGAIETLAPSIQWGNVRDIVVGATRLYVSNYPGLVSLEFDGTDPRDEDVVAESVVGWAGVLYYASFGNLYRWSEAQRTPELIREFPGSQSIELAAGEYSAFLLVSYPSDLEPARYELYYLTAQSEPVLCEVGIGLAGGLVTSTADAYFAVRYESGIELRHVDSGGDAVVLDSNASDLVEMTAVAGGVFATFFTVLERGLRYYSFHSSPVIHEWPTRGELVLPTSTPDGELWFVDTSQAALVRSNPAGRF